MKFNELNILDFGNEIQLAGVVYSGKNKNFLCVFPDERLEGNLSLITPEMDLNDWEKLLRQTDLLETEILMRDKSGKIVKGLIRKTTRQIEQGVSWKVYHRDNYTCRYCGITGIPMTVDHLVLWEEGGPSIVDNLITACRKCNKKRGNMQYQDWVDSEYYKSVSQSLSDDQREINWVLQHELDKIPRKIHKHKR